MGVSLNGGIYTPTTPQNDHFFWQTHGCLVPPFQKGNPKNGW